ncbi:response regulator [Cohnella cellulosilytica]|uniref:Response regulator n=1 Tax=Cohnella cellulosilytica TaxID=986710 RepID=A0ABW2F896_9BACL
MYNILIVDDEPLICKGLSSLLQTSGLDLDRILIAYNAYEALDCIRMENVDVLVTDIQMGAMNGIELMYQAKMIKPWLETIVISAHETFQYAQMAIRLGAKDYLIKPLNNEHFLNTVRNVILNINRPVSAEHPILSGTRDHFQMEHPDSRKSRYLQELLTNPAAAADRLPPPEGCGESPAGPYFAVIRVHLQFPDVSERDENLLRYAALNIVSELLDQESNCQAFYAEPDEICILFQWNEADYADTTVNKINQLEIIGRSLHYNIEQYLRLENVVGISQILKGTEFLAQLNEQAIKAVKWNDRHKDHYVFYFGDYKWGIQSEELTEEEWISRNNFIVEKVKEYIDVHFRLKGLTLNEIAHKNHVSPNYLSYLFKKYMGCNLWEYVIKLRMEESKRLILTTDLRRYEIADRVGYESPEHFSKIFKKYFGCSPSELKK